MSSQTSHTDEEGSTAENEGTARRTESKRGDVDTLWRRRFLKGVGAAGLGIGLAGCSGDGNGTATGQGGTPASGGDSETSTADTGDQAQISSVDDISGTTITFWTQNANQSPTTRKAMEKHIAAFEDETGVTVKMNAVPGPVVQKQLWVETFKSGNYPVINDLSGHHPAMLYKEDWVEPYSRYKHLIGDDIKQQYEWAMSGIREAYSGFDVESYIVPWNMYCFAQMIARRDHFKQAGLDPDSDFPPDGYEHFLEVARTLQNDGPAEYGTYITGDQGDVMDMGLTLWTVAEAGEKGFMVTEDGLDSRLNNDVWIKQAKRFNAVFNEHELTSPGTPSASDESFVPGLIQGKWSMGWAEAPRYPLFLEQDPGMVEDGTIMWGEHFTSPDGHKARLRPSSFSINRKPPNADRATWTKKQNAAVRFIEHFFKEDFQTRIPDFLGLVPGREDVLDSVESNYRDDHLIPVTIQQARGTDVQSGTHPIENNILYNIAPPHFQNMLRGKLTPKEACEKAHQETLQFL